MDPEPAQNANPVLTKVVDTSTMGQLKDEIKRNTETIEVLKTEILELEGTLQEATSAPGKYSRAKTSLIAHMKSKITSKEVRHSYRSCQ